MLALLLVAAAGWAEAQTGQETMAAPQQPAATSQDAAAKLEQQVATMLVNKLGQDAATIR
jgi:hypothetical protein